MKTLQFREAIQEAMSEEMRRDETIYLMGEEVAEYNGAYKASKGMLDEFGAKRVIDTPISENGFTGIAIGSSMNGNRPIVEYMPFNFSLVAPNERGTIQYSHCFSGANGFCRATCGNAQPSF